METLTCAQATKANYSIPKLSSWTIDTANSKAEFAIKSLGVFIKGTFKGLKGEICFDGKNLVYSNITASLDVNTLRTGILLLDKLLLRSNYLDEHKYPQITFRSESITTLGSGYRAVGNLIIKGNWRTKTIPFTFEEDGRMGIFGSKFIIDRLDFDIGKRNSFIANAIKVKLTAVAIRNVSI